MKEKSKHTNLRKSWQIQEFKLFFVAQEAKLKYPELAEQVKDYRNQIQGAESYGDIDIADCAYAVLDKDGQKLALEGLDGIEYKTE